MGLYISWNGGRGRMEFSVRDNIILPCVTDLSRLSSWRFTTPPSASSPRRRPCTAWDTPTSRRTVPAAVCGRPSHSGSPRSPSSTVSSDFWCEHGRMIFLTEFPKTLFFSFLMDSRAYVLSYHWVSCNLLTLYPSVWCLCILIYFLKELVCCLLNTTKHFDSSKTPLKTEQFNYGLYFVF